MKRILVLMGMTLVLILSGCVNNEVNNNNTEEAGEENGETTVTTEDKVWNNIQESGVLTVGTSGTLYPSSYYPEDSDELTGFEVEIQKEIADRLGLDIEFETMAFDATLSALDSGRIDMAALGLRGENKERFAYTQPIKYSYATMIVRSDDNSGINSLEDLEGKIAGGAATTVYSEIAEKFGAEVKTYGNATNDAYLRDVHNGRTDVVINDYYLQSLAIQAFPDFNIHLHPDLKFHTSTSSIVMPKGAEKLHEEVDQIISDMLEDGTLKEISETFFDGQDVSVEPEEEIIEIEGIAK